MAENKTEVVIIINNKPDSTGGTSTGYNMEYTTLENIVRSNVACIYGMNYRIRSFAPIDMLYPYWLAYHPGVKFIQTKKAALAFKIAKLLGCREVHSEHRKGAI